MSTSAGLAHVTTLWTDPLKIRRLGPIIDTMLTPKCFTIKELHVFTLLFCPDSDTFAPVYGPYLASTERRATPPS